MTHAFKYTAFCSLHFNGSKHGNSDIAESYNPLLKFDPAPDSMQSTMAVLFRLWPFPTQDLSRKGLSGGLCALGRDEKNGWAADMQHLQNMFQDRALVCLVVKCQRVSSKSLQQDGKFLPVSHVESIYRLHLPQQGRCQ